MASIHKAVHSATYFILPYQTHTRWIHWGGTGGDYSPYRDILPNWVSGGAPNDPNPVLITEWKGIGITAGGAQVVTIKVKNQSAGTIGVRFILIKVLN